MKAALYVRISQDRKVNGEFTTLGVQRQEEDCRALADRLGWEVATMYVDNDISATSGKPRPAYRQMLAAMQAGHIAAVLTWHPDRLYRRTTELEELVEVCDRHRILIATAQSGDIDLTTPSGRLVARLLGATARYEVEHKAERWRLGWAQRRKAGQPVRSGTRTFGYTHDLDIVEAEAAAIRTAASEVLRGGSVRGAAHRLNEAGWRTVRGNPWTVNSLKQLLANPRLAGWVTHKGAIVARSTGHQAILSDAESEALRVLLSGREAGRTYPRRATLLGLAHCGVCGARMVTAGRSGGYRRTYRCPPATGGGHGCTEVVAERVEHIVEGYARARLEDPRVQGALDALGGDERARAVALELAGYEARLREVEAAIADADGQPVAALLRSLATLTAKIEDARQRLAGTVPTGHFALGAAWPPDEDVERRAALVRVAVARVLVDRAEPGSHDVRARLRIEPR